MSYYFIKEYLLFICLGCILYGCNSIAPLPLTDHREDIERFQQVTTNDERVCGVDYGFEDQLLWYPGNKFQLVNNDLDIIFISDTFGFSDIYVRELNDEWTKRERITSRINVLDLSYVESDNTIVFTGVKRFLSFNSKASFERIPSIYMVDTARMYSLLIDRACYAVLSRNGRNLFYTDLVNNELIEIDLLNKDKRVLCKGIAPQLTGDPDILLFTRNTFENGRRSEIWEINIKTLKEKQILAMEDYGFSNPRVSPDGDKIVMCGSYNKSTETIPNLDLFLCNRNGSDLEQLTFHPGCDASPQWGYKGEFIYFVSERGCPSKKFNIWKFNVNEK
jgi:Tol biopolymer transport system component